MSKRRLELPSLTAHEPQSCMYTIPSPRHFIVDFVCKTDIVLSHYVCTVIIVIAVSSYFCDHRALTNDLSTYYSIFMKILSNFDTRLYDEMKNDYINQYGRENVMFIRRASIFFWIYIVAPLIAMLSVIAVMMWLSFWVTINDTALHNIVQIGSLTGWVIILGFRGCSILKRYMDYTMDFCIITPKELVSYNQSWLFNRHTEIIDTEKVKTINKIPQGFFGSIFNFANLVFLSEWDMDVGDISLNYVENPEQVYKEVRKIIEPHLNKQAWEQVFVK